MRFKYDKIESNIRALVLLNFSLSGGCGRQYLRYDLLVGRWMHNIRRHLHLKHFSS